MNKQLDEAINNDNDIDYISMLTDTSFLDSNFLDSKE